MCSLLWFAAGLAVIAASPVPLVSYWNTQRQDNFVTGTAAGMAYAAAHGYVPIQHDADGWLPSNTTQIVGSVPLLQYESDSHTYLLASDASKAEAASKGYVAGRVEGYVFPHPALGQELVELRQYYSADRQDYFLCVQGSSQEAAAIQAKYTLLRVEGYTVLQQFTPFTWPNAAPADIPFPRSSLFTEVEFTGRYATYGGADTWYPTWAADGNLYTPWTDGTVNGVKAGSGCSGPDCMSTTGFATVVGDDPFNLTVEAVGAFASSPSPYHGRYPCGSLFFNSTWFYGTYTLDNENHQPGSQRLGVDAAGYCENWCIQGPFAGFRTSQDHGVTWNEPRVHMKNWTDNIFGEEAPDNHTSKVKYGAPHVVDLGQELEHTPEGDAQKMMYIVGHGASKPYSPTSWMQASEVYMARVVPDIDSVEDRSKWEFFAGDGKWAKGDVSQAKPLLTWGNRTGVTTMTYLPAVKRYLVCISTPTFSPFTEQQFDTYFLESENISGPFSYISYMRMFGPQSYFVNVPSKFISSKLDTDGSLRIMLSYSANFRIHSKGPNPPGSGYHWTLQEMKLRPGKALSPDVFV